MINSLVDASAPATRLAALRIVVGVFTLGYLLGRSPVFLALGDRPAVDFAGVGILTWLDRPIPAPLLQAIVGISIASGVASVVGWRYRPASIMFATGMLLLATFRGSWGQLLHFENLMVLQLLVLAAAPAADAWSLDARRLARTALQPAVTTERDCATGSVRYGWPIALLGMITIITYVIAGIAKLRYGGIDWVSGDTMRNHIAYSATRLDLIGGTPPLLAEFVVRHGWALGVFAAGAVVIEVAAPMVLIGHRSRNAWVGAAWLMHVGILLTMSVGFPSPLFGVAFAPFFALERVEEPLARRWQTARRRPSPA
ncbi:MAG: HTTM domain-containing protein [Ilumatobacter sp.]